MSSVEQAPINYELSPSAEILSRRFIQRWDMYPKQLSNGVWITIHEPLHVGLLFAHLRGEITLGSYLLTPDSQGRYLVLDADTDYAWQQLTQMSRSLHARGCPGYMETSRRGGHLWFFFNDWMPGYRIRDFADGLLASHEIKEIEIYPKQAVLAAGPGSLIRLPFGKHQLTQRRYPFHDSKDIPIAATIRDQVHTLGSASTVSETAFSYFAEHGEKLRENGRFRPSKVVRGGLSAVDVDSSLSEQIKATMSVREFVSQFVHLSASGKGLCPFHDDHAPSFSVNDHENYWHCFACNIGGSIIDFWMYQQKCSFPTAIQQLATDLLGTS